MTSVEPVGSPSVLDKQHKLLFAACWAALVATSFTFIVRSLILDDLGKEFALDATQKGAIVGAGLWPFSISIILFSLVLDKIGYGRAMIFAFAAHTVSAIMILTAHGYSQLYWATFICALANGTVEAVINPVVATAFSKEKTKWLNILHAGWPGGLVLGGILALLMGTASWKLKVALPLIPTVLYGIMMIGRQWPVHERVAAGVSYKDMLKEFGILSCLVVAFLIFSQIGTVFGLPLPVTIGLIVVATAAFGAASGWSLGRGLFIILVLIMIPLATAELGTDGWITSLMEPQMKAMGLPAGIILVYTSFIMMMLRMFAGKIVHRISPLGLLATAAAIATCGLLFLSTAAGVMILVAATIYGIGKSFFWPTMLGVVSEQFPRGGALTLNGIAGVGMLGVGIVGAVFLGYIQDTAVSTAVKAKNDQAMVKTIHTQNWVFGTYEAVDQKAVETLTADEQKQITELSNDAKKAALSKVAIFPLIMMVSYLGLIAFFKGKGGYKPVDIAAA